jgi:histidine triad (HIT) family protein
MEKCIFCKIINKNLNSTIIYEDDVCIAFKDIYPKADIHILIVPKKHIISMLEIDSTNQDLIGQLMVNVNKIAKQLNLEGYKVNINNGVKGGQEVFHLHIHLLANL